MSGPEAAARALAAEAAERERVKLAERWLALPGNESLHLHAADEWLLWTKTLLPDGRWTHGGVKWETVKRDLGEGAGGEGMTMEAVDSLGVIW